VSSRTVDLLVTLALGLAMFAFALATPNITGGDDAYRHVRFAWRLATDTRAAIADPWKLDFLSPHASDIWFGYHLLLAPLTLIMPLILAAKIVGVGIWTATLYAILRFLNSLNIQWRHAWGLLAMTGSSIVLYRALLVRPFLFSLLLVILAARYTIEEKRWNVALIAAVHAISYSIFFFAGLPAGIAFLLRRTKRSFLLGVIAGLAMLAALALSPFFPTNLTFAIEQSSTRIGADVGRLLKIGREAQPLTGFWLLASIPVMLVWMGAIVRCIWRVRVQRPSVPEALTFGVSLFALLMSFRAARMFDYFVPFAVIFAAIALSPLIAQHRERFAYGFGALFLGAAFGIIPSYAASTGAPSLDRYRDAAQFLARQPNATVFNTEWQQYPFLYYWDWNSRYLTGLDPTFFYKLDEARYWEWRKLADDEADAATLDDRIFSDFHATHMLVDRKLTPKLATQLASNPRIAEVFHDSELSVFTLRTN
jgi:hypothetical protein